MKHYRVLVLLAALFAVGSVPIVSVACNRPVTVITPAGKAAFTANEVLLRVERLQDAVIAANKSGALPLDTTRAVVFVTVQLAEVADAATQGWQASARQVWEQAKKELAVLRPGGQFALLAATIDEVLAGGVQ